MRCETRQAYTFTRQMRLVITVIQMLFLTACATPAATPPRVEPAAATPSVAQAAPSGGELSVLAMTPEDGSSLVEGSVIQAQLKYRVSAPRRDAVYGIAPFFADARGDQRRFSPLQDLAALTPLKSASGSVTLVFPLKRVWSDTRLQKPVIVWLDLIEQAPNQTPKVLSEIGPFTYK
jgi:hypothetical protein